MNRFTKSKNLDIFLVRHAQSKQNADINYTDNFHEDDAPLSDFGKNQAHKLSLRFRDGDIDKIYSSCLIRTVQTVYPTAEKFNKKIIMLPELNEVGTAIHGTDNKNFEEYKLAVPCSGEKSPAGGKMVYDGEKTEELIQRAELALDYIISNAADGEKIMIVSHCAFFGYLLRGLLGISLPESFCWKVENCALTHIRLRKNDIPILINANDKSHLG